MHQHMWGKTGEDHNGAVNRWARSENGNDKTAFRSRYRSWLCWKGAHLCLSIFWMLCGILKSFIFISFQASERYEEREDNVNHEFGISAFHFSKYRKQKPILPFSSLKTCFRIFSMVFLDRKGTFQHFQTKESAAEYSLLRAAHLPTTSHDQHQLLFSSVLCFVLFCFSPEENRKRNWLSCY